ncbi:MAG TPA: hypothetical protein VM118_14830, partial [Acidobacteriota bacterium]|nr:hypothetical protein [Acidobacteriota bacterium]
MLLAMVQRGPRPLLRDPDVWLEPLERVPELRDPPALDVDGGRDTDGGLLRWPLERVLPRLVVCGCVDTEPGSEPLLVFAGRAASSVFFSVAPDSTFFVETLVRGLFCTAVLVEPLLRPDCTV